MNIKTSFTLQSNMLFITKSLYKVIWSVCVTVPKDLANRWTNMTLLCNVSSGKFCIYLRGEIASRKETLRGAKGWLTGLSFLQGCQNFLILKLQLRVKWLPNAEILLNIVLKFCSVAAIKTNGVVLLPINWKYIIIMPSSFRTHHWI